jgi:beta-glucosidase/6-phospho-beta-glucosidase/beta-galactosidase
MREGYIELVFALYHWDLPQALQDRSSWISRETSERFVSSFGSSVV